MKRTVILWVLMAALGASAKPVDRATASSVAERYLTDVVDITPQGWTEIYVFAPRGGEGFVVVSADDCTVPVLAFSLSQTFDTADMPPHVASWLEGYRREVASLRKAGIEPSKQVAALWLPTKGAAKSTTVGPLMTTQWSQSPYYNDRCPYAIGTSQRVVTGCVATATAQVMKYWNHPSVGHGSYSYTASGVGTLSVDFDTAYRWTRMPDKLSRRSSSSQVEAVARLMYHVGVAVAMKYGVHSSGAQVVGSGPSSESALKNYFRYSPALHGVSKSRYSDADWNALMRGEIDHRRPVLYAGFDATGGHAFVLDGYRQDGGRCYFHVNWGWGGAYDGYFTLDSLSPGGGGTGGNATYTFNMGNEAVVGIQPSGASEGIDVSVVQVAAADPSTGTVGGSGRYATYQDRVQLLAEAAEGYRFDHWASGALCNPQLFTANGDYSDTAYFVPMGTDTVGYSPGRMHSTWHDNSRATSEWGIRLPASVRQRQRGLSAVSLFVYAGGDYTLSIHLGDTVDASTLVHRQRFFVRSVQDWVAIDLDSVVYVDNYKPLWIVLSYRDDGYPAARAAYGGHADGSWYRKSGRWQILNESGQRYSWMVRGIFVERRERQFAVSLSTAMNDSSQVPLGCSASGAGVYAEDSLVTLLATHDSDHVFLYWLGADGDTVRANPYRYHPPADNSYTAVFRFQRLGIGDVQAATPRVSVAGRIVSAECPAASRLLLFDAGGRMMAASRGGQPLRCRRRNL